VDRWGLAVTPFGDSQHRSAMPIFRVTCACCGLAATHIASGDRGLTSFDAEECMSRCESGRAAKATGVSFMPCELDCPHLKAAVRARIEEAAADTVPPER